MKDHSSPYDPYQRRFYDEEHGQGLQPMPAPQPELRRLSVAVMDREKKQ